MKYVCFKRCFSLASWAVTLKLLYDKFLKFFCIMSWKSTCLISLLLEFFWYWMYCPSFVSGNLANQVLYQCAFQYVKIILLLMFVNLLPPSQHWFSYYNISVKKGSCNMKKLMDVQDANLNLILIRAVASIKLILGD